MNRTAAAVEAEVRPSRNHPTVDLPAYLEGPRLPTTFDPASPFGSDFDCCASGTCEGLGGAR